MQNIEHSPAIEQEHLKNNLQEKLTNFLNKMLDQAGLIAEKAHDVLRNFIPSNVPTFPRISGKKLMHVMRRYTKPKDRHRFTIRKKLQRRQPIPNQTVTITD